MYEGRRHLASESLGGLTRSDWRGLLKVLAPDYGADPVVRLAAVGAYRVWERARLVCAFSGCRRELVRRPGDRRTRFCRVQCARRAWAEAQRKPRRLRAN